MYAKQWGVTVKRKQGHTSKRTQMSPIWCDPDVAQWDVDAFGQWRRSAFHPSVHTVHITSGSSLGVRNNIRSREKKNKSQSGTVGAVLEQRLYKCIGFAASYLHKSCHVSICYASKALGYRARCNRNMTVDTIYLAFFGCVVETKRSKYMVRRQKCVSFSKTGRRQAGTVKQHTLEKPCQEKTKNQKHQAALALFHSRETNVGDTKALWLT